MINWNGSSILDHDDNKHSRWIRESVYIRKSGPLAMNRDCGQYQLPTVYNGLLRHHNMTTGGAKSRPFKVPRHDVTHLPTTEASV